MATPMTAFKRSKNLQEIIGGHTVKLRKVFKKSLDKLNGKSMPCSSTRPLLCCTQRVSTQTFKSEQTKRTFNIFHKLTRKSICHLFNGMHIIQNPLRRKILDPFNLRLKSQERCH